MLRCEDTIESLMQWLEEYLQEIMFKALETRMLIEASKGLRFKPFKHLEPFIFFLEMRWSIEMRVQSRFTIARELKRDWLAFSLISLH